DRYLDEMLGMLETQHGVSCDQSTVWRTLKRADFTMKKICPSFAYVWVCSSCVSSLPARPWSVVPMTEDSSCFVLVNDSHHARQYSWMRALLIVVQKYLLLPALSMDGVLYAKVVEGSFNAARSRTFIEGLLNQMDPWPAPNSVIVMDNARIHKDPGLIQII
ncbi:hypothetical protein PENSPDRAFT_566467, partial [Peniophora sp. CONT]